MITPEQEASISKQQYDLIIQQYHGKILPDFDKRVKRVRNVLERLIPSSGLTGLKWEIHVIESEEVNAFVIPGYVTSTSTGFSIGKRFGILWEAKLTNFTGARCLFSQQFFRFVRTTMESLLFWATRLHTQSLTMPRNV
jgi:hypothetical protein